MNTALIGEYSKRATNHQRLLDALKDVNQMIQKAAKLRSTMTPCTPCTPCNPCTPCTPLEQFVPSSADKLHPYEPHCHSAMSLPTVD